MTTQQPESLQLADALERRLPHDAYELRVQTEAAAELRRLSDVERALEMQGKALRRLSEHNAKLERINAQLLEALEALLWYVGQLEMIVYSADDTGEHEEVTKARAAIAAAKGEA